MNLYVLVREEAEDPKMRGHDPFCIVRATTRESAKEIARKFDRGYGDRSRIDLIGVSHGSVEGVIFSGPEGGFDEKPVREEA